MLGVGIDPRFNQMDYSGFVRAAETSAQAQAQLGKDIGGAISTVAGGFVEKKKEQKENEKLIQKSDTVAKSIAQLIPELAPTIEESRAILSDLNVPQERRLAEAEAIRDVLGLGISEVRNRQEIALKQGELGLQSRRLGLEQARAITEAEALQSKPPSTIEVPDGKGGQILMQFDPQTRTYVPLDVTLPAGAPNPDTWQRPTSAKGIKVDNITDANRFVAPGGLVDTSYLNVINKVPTDYNIENPLLPTLEQAENPASSPYYGMPGYTPPKQENKFVSAPPEVAAQYGATAGQIDLTTGRFYPINPPSGFELVTDEQGVKTFRQGPGVGGAQSRFSKAEESQKKMSFEATKSIVGSALNVLTPIESGVAAKQPVVAALQKGISQVLPASESGQIAKELENLRVTTSKESINLLRSSSPTGSAGGTITEREWPKFESRFGAMEMGMNPDQLAKNVKITALNQWESANLPPEEVIELYQKGKLGETQEENQRIYDEYVDEYVSLRSRLGIPNYGIENYDWTKMNPEIWRYSTRYSSGNIPKTTRIGEQQPTIAPDVQELMNKFNPQQQNR